MLAEYRDLFITETEEHIALLNRSLIALEKDRSHVKLVDNIFRSAHTLKSSAAAVGFPDLSRLAHKAEDLMQNVRAGNRTVSDAIVDALFKVFDLFKDFIDRLKSNRPTDQDYSSVMDLLDQVISRDDAAITPDCGLPAASAEWTPSASEESLISSLPKDARLVQADIILDERESLKWLRAELVLNKAGKTGTVISLHPAKNEFLKPSFSGAFSLLFATSLPDADIEKALTVDLVKHISLSVPVLRRSEAGSAFPAVAVSKKSSPEIRNPADPAPEGRDPTPSSQGDHTGRRTGETIRVPVEKLDMLMNLIGEMITSVSGFQQIRKRIRTATKDKVLIHQVANFGDRIANISSELQFHIMTTRMLPLATVFDQFHRVVRDASLATGHKAELTLSGEETELDKKIIDSIGEPLMHLVRNAVDHGLESPEERRAKGKPETGSIRLAAGRHGNQIVISVSDDGRGLDTAMIRNKALERGLTDAERIAAMTDEQVWQFIFEPAFSTSEKISAISGRGVGLDIVRTVVSALNGTVEIRSESGAGCEFLLNLPLTLATTSVILAISGRNLYAVPINDIRETLTVRPDQIRTVEGHPVIPLREEILPLVSLRDLFHDTTPEKPANRFSIMIVAYRESRIGLVIDRIAGTDDVVIKPLEKNFRSLKGVSGAAILGDGRIALVLDAAGLTSLSRGIPIPQADSATSSPSSVSRLPAKSDSKRLETIFQEAFSSAAKRLSIMTGRTMTVKSPDKTLPVLMDPQEFINASRDRMERLYFGSLIRTDSDIPLKMLLLVPEEDGADFYELMTGDAETAQNAHNDDLLAAIGEMNNVMSSSLVNILADSSGREIHAVPPRNSRDMLGSLLQNAVLGEDLPDRRILCAESVFADEGGHPVHTRMLVLAEQSSLDNLLRNHPRTPAQETSP
jgi:two-component system chemotaxis sensor kinase CheA